MAVKSDLDDVEEKRNLLPKENDNSKEYLQFPEVNDQKKYVKNTDVIPADTQPQNSLDIVNSNKSRTVGGEVAVVGSEKVIIGNNIYFNSSVRVKKFKKKVLGSKKSSVKDEKVNVKNTEDNQEEINKTTDNIFELRKCHINTFGVACVGTVSVIVVILSNIIAQYNHEDRSVGMLGLFYENLPIIIIAILFIPLVLVLIANALLRIFNPAFKSKKPDVNDEEEMYDSLMRPLKKVKTAVVTPEGLRIVPRTVWHAAPVVCQLDEIRQPVPWAIISHTATAGCNTQSECVRHVRVIQGYHKDSKDWDDIGYNFLVGGDGAAYCGRGWDYIGAHTLGYNKYSIGISFIGTFIHHPPPKRQLEACKKLLKRGVALGKLAKGYKLFAHKQLWATQSPGDKLFDIIKEWPHFVKEFNDISELLPGY